MANVTAKTAIAFYAPLKSPLHPIPSGDRKIARLFIQALEQGGFQVELASNLRTFDKTGDAYRQQRLIGLAKKQASRIMRRWQKTGFRPQAWFSYHLYYKAPDLLGPIICQKLNIPYIVAEASWAEKRANSPWALYHQQVDFALKIASKVICINPIDKVALTDYYAAKTQLKSSRLVSVNAFIDDFPMLTDTDTDALAEVAVTQAAVQLKRDQIASQFGLDTHLPWMITIAMMRTGDKFDSYRQLSAIVDKLQQTQQLLIVGDGLMQTEVHNLFAQHRQVKFAGALENNQIRQLLPHFELLVWPAINEALGMIFLEAQQAGVAIVAGDQGGVSSIVKNQVTGVLVDVSDSESMATTMPTTMSTNMANTIDRLLQDPKQLKKMQQAAKHYINQHHCIAASAIQLNAIIEAVILTNLNSG